MIRPILYSTLIFTLTLLPVCAESVEQLQAKLSQATREIEALKAKLAESQIAVQTAKAGNNQPPPSASLLDAEHPILTAYEFAALAAADNGELKAKLKGKVISVRGKISGFSDGVGRSFKVILKADGVDRDVVCKFYAPGDIASVHTAADGGEMIFETENRGSILLATAHEEVIISGFFGKNTRTQVTLTDCVLQKK